MINRIGIVWALLGAIIWGLVYNIDQKVLEKTSPLTMFVVGGAMQMIVLMPYIFTKQGSEDILTILKDKNQLMLLFSSEMLLIVAGVAILYAVKYLNAPTAAVFEIIYPFYVALFSYFLFNGRLNTNFIVGSVLIFLGSALIAR